MHQVNQDIFNLQFAKEGVLEDQIDSRGYPLLMVREVMKQLLIDNFCVISAVNPGALTVCDDRPSHALGVCANQEPQDSWRCPFVLERLAQDLPEDPQIHQR
jgi:hypothetical protein